MKKIKLTLACLMFTTAIFVVSCKKNSDKMIDPTSTEDTDVSGADDNALAENSSNDIVEIGAQATDIEGMASFRLANGDELLTACATVDTSNKVNKIITVVFNGSTCMDGRTRSGSVTFDFSASAPLAKHYRDPGFSVTITSNNYVVDGNQININSKTVTNTTAAGFDPSTTNETWHITADISITKANGKTISWVCDRVKTLLNTATAYHGHQNPIDWPHARIGITGNASGTRGNGETFTVNVTSMLVRDFGSCHVPSNGHNRVPFIEGTLTYTPGSKAPRYVDYGAPNNGACDLLADVTIKGHVFHVTLP